MIRAAAYRGLIHIAGKRLLWPALALVATVILAVLVLTPDVAASPLKLIPKSSTAAAAPTPVTTTAAAQSPPTALEQAAALSVDGKKFTDSVLPEGAVVELAVQHDEEALVDFLHRYDQLDSPKTLVQVNRRTASLSGERWVALVPIRFESTEEADAWCEPPRSQGQDVCDVVVLTSSG